MNYVELCAGAGGLSLGLEAAGWTALGLIENDAAACATLRANRPQWPVLEQDVRTFDGEAYQGVALLAGSPPCQPWSRANNKRRGPADERNLWPDVLRLVEQMQPQAVLFENVAGFAEPRFEAYRCLVQSRLGELGYHVAWRLLWSCEYGVPQFRRRFVLVGLRGSAFVWPERTGCEGPIIEALAGHSGGGTSCARARLRALGLYPMSFETAVLYQRFPATWQFCGTSRQRQQQLVNAVPPPLGTVLGRSIKQAMEPLT